ncbi:YolD-like family protein [Priestia megaterium]|uniref:YolD-like family protein n=1 Tax=Priestia megaterium TaxID=1404 RepID=UPI00366F322A
MILKSLIKNKLVTINYYEDGVLKTYIGRINKLNIFEQTLFLEDSQRNILSMKFSGISDIY